VEYLHSNVMESNTHGGQMKNEIPIGTVTADEPCRRSIHDLEEILDSIDQEIARLQAMKVKMIEVKQFINTLPTG
jgi:hypothetical protein